jgi:hypothetical protein
MYGGVKPEPTYLVEGVLEEELLYRLIRLGDLEGDVKDKSEGSLDVSFVEASGPNGIYKTICPKRSERK